MVFVEGLCGLIVSYIGRGRLFINFYLLGLVGGFIGVFSL